MRLNDRLQLIHLAHHLSFAVPSRTDLDAAVARLDELGVAHDGVKDIGIGQLLEFRDPDGIALELWADAE